MRAVTQKAPDAGQGIEGTSSANQEAGRTMSMVADSIQNVTPEADRKFTRAVLSTQPQALSTLERSWLREDEWAAARLAAAESYLERIPVDEDRGLARSILKRHPHLDPEFICGQFIPSYDSPSGSSGPSWPAPTVEWQWDGDHWMRTIERPFRLPAGGGFDVVAHQEYWGPDRLTNELVGAVLDFKEDTIASVEEMRQVGQWLIEAADLLDAEEES